MTEACESIPSQCATDVVMAIANAVVLNELTVRLLSGCTIALSVAETVASVVDIVGEDEVVVDGQLDDHIHCVGGLRHEGDDVILEEPDADPELHVLSATHQPHLLLNCIQSSQDNALGHCTATVVVVVAWVEDNVDVDDVCALQFHSH